MTEPIYDPTTAQITEALRDHTHALEWWSLGASKWVRVHGSSSVLGDLRGVASDQRQFGYRLVPIARW